MEYFVLSNGLKIPATGSGTNTFAKTDKVYNGSTREVRSAIEAGYRLFDTAEAYRNEEAVGNGITISMIITCKAGHVPEGWPLPRLPGSGL